MRLIIKIIGVALSIYLAVASYGELSLINLQDQKDGPTGEAEEVKYDGLEFKNKTQMIIYQKEKMRNRYYPWVEPMDKWHLLTLLALAGGYIGGCVKDFHYRLSNNAWATKHYDLLGLIVSGSFIGIWMLIKHMGHFSDFGEGYIFSLCFLIGIFSSEAWTFIEVFVERFFAKEQGG